MLSIEIKPTESFGEKIYGLSARVRHKWDQRLDALTELLYDKVIANVSGKILQSKTGDLKSRIVKESFHSGYEFIGFVGINQATPKDYALEFGGTGPYTITPKEKLWLYWYDQYSGPVFAKHVNHPPSREYRYIREAEEEVRLLAPKELLVGLMEE